MVQPQAGPQHRAVHSRAVAPGRLFLALLLRAPGQAALGGRRSHERRARERVADYRGGQELCGTSGSRVGGGFPTEMLMDAEGTQRAGGGAQPSRGEPSCRTAFRAALPPAATGRGAGSTLVPHIGGTATRRSTQSLGQHRPQSLQASNRSRRGRVGPGAALAARGAARSNTRAPNPRPRSPRRRVHKAGPARRPQLRARGQGGSHAAGRGNAPRSPAGERDGTDHPTGPPAAVPPRRGGRGGLGTYRSPGAEAAAALPGSTQRRRG